MHFNSCRENIVKKIIYLLLTCSCNCIFAQQTVKKADLNKDGIIDFVIITQDSSNDHLPYQLQIYFGQANDSPRLIVTTIKAIQPQFPNGRDGYTTGNEFNDININKAVISISNQLLRGHFEHKFRFQNGNFELIGCSLVYSDGMGTITTTDFNLSTGVQIVTKERYDTDKVLSRTKKKILIRPLPRLQDFTPFENELY